MNKEVKNIQLILVRKLDRLIFLHFQYHLDCVQLKKLQFNLNSLLVINQYHHHLINLWVKHIQERRISKKIMEKKEGKEANHLKNAKLNY